jgi:hypothetical protein
MRMTIATIALGSLLALATDAQASTPATIDLTVPVSNDEPVIRWVPVKGAERYELTGTFVAIRVNRQDGFCTPPLTADSYTFDISETLGPDATEFALPLPDLPAGDGWFLADSNVLLEAFDGEGVQLAGTGARGLGETNAVCATETLGPVLPVTGSATPERHSLAIVVLAGVLAASGMVLVGAARLRNR